MTSGQHLLEKISGFHEEKIKRIIERRENTHIQVLKDLNLIHQSDSVQSIIDRVLSVGLEFEDLHKLTKEFVSVCLFVLEVDNPLLDELVVLRNRTVEEWNRVKKKLLKETKPSRFFKGKPYEDEKTTEWFHSCLACEECRDKKQQQETLENQLKGYFPINLKSKPVEKSELEQLQICVRKLQNECIRCWEIGEEFGGLLKKPGWQTSYVFGTDKLAQVLRRHLNDKVVFDSTNLDTWKLGISQELMTAIEHIQKPEKGDTCQSSDRLDIGVFKLAETGVRSGFAEEFTAKIEGEINELKDKPPSKADILRTLTRHSVGILLWKNHCQASVTCVGENVVLTAAHLFTPDKSEIWNHLILMYCEKMFPSSALKLRTFCNLRQQCYKDLAKSKNRGKGLEESFKKFIKEQWEIIKTDTIQELEEKSNTVLQEMREEIKKLAEIREEDLVNLYAEEIKIHIGHIEDVEDHFKAKCCRYYVKEVVLLDHELDVAVLKIAESNDFQPPHGKDDIMYIRQEIVPMPITSAPVPDGHLFIAAHPFGKTLCMESSVKLLDDSEKSVFVENFITQAIVQACSKSRISILRHVENAETVCARLPVCFWGDKYKYEAVENLIKRNDTNLKIAHLEYHEETEYDFEKGFIILTENYEKVIKIPIKTKKEVSTKAKRLLIPGQEGKENQWHEYDFKKFLHSDLPKRGDLQIPIQKISEKNGQPYRFILTSKYDQASYACQVDEKEGTLEIKKLNNPIIVEESNKSVVLCLVTKVNYIKCEIVPACEEKGKFKLNDKEIKDACSGTVKLESLEDQKPENEVPVEIRMDKPFNLPELSLSLQKDSEGKLSLLYNFREGRAKSGKTFYFSLKQEKLLNIELDYGMNKKRAEKHSSRILKVKVDEKNPSNENVEDEQNPNEVKKYPHKEDVRNILQDIMMKNVKKKNDAIRLKEEVQGESWIGNILIRRHYTDGHKYCNLELKYDITGTLSYRAIWQKRREWTMEDKIKCVVWPTFSWSTDFVLEFCKTEKSRVTLSIHNTADSYRIMEYFDPNGKHSIRQIHLPVTGNPTVPGKIIYVENKRLGKLGSANKEMKSHFKQTLNRSLSTNEIKEYIVTEEIKIYGREKYIRMEQLTHTKLIDMEHGASGGACCFIGEQGQLLFHGMFLGACPSFYYNDAECKLFFNKTGTCFNEVLPSKCLIDILENSTGKAKLDRNPKPPESFYIKIEN
uniref:Uncharacterized protein n=1 Tax=Magallana gigas TaxID=29159 RepID=A0A8W8KUJ4_MAGGI|nr:uncharacterized protein LOC105338019 isoform X3 [Crassostrea gigas]